MQSFSIAGAPEGGGTRRRTMLAAFLAGTLLLAGCGKPSGQVVQKKPPKAGPPELVHLKWKNNTNEWVVQLNNGPEKKPADAETILDPNRGPTMFIVDITGKPVTFQSPGGLTVWEGSKSGNRGSDQILGPEVTKGGKLVFWNLNYGDRVKIYYSLNLSDGTSVDPIIDNGGGNWP